MKSANTKLDLENIDSVIENVVRKTIENHTVSKKIHEEIMIMMHSNVKLIRNILLG